MSVEAPQDTAALADKLRRLLAAERGAREDAEGFVPLEVIEGGRRIVVGRLSEHFRSLVEPLPGFAVARGEALLLGEAPERTRALAAAASRLAAAGFIAEGPEELVSLVAEDRALGNGPLGELPRKLVRALGVRTRVVRLTAFAPEAPETLGALGDWLAPMLVLSLRSPKKRIGPGLWDSVAAGMMQAGEDERQALARESAEEAGLLVETLSCEPCPSIEVAQTADRGWMRESVSCFAATLPEGTSLTARDGEVSRFAVVSAAELLDLIEARRLMPQAAIASLSALDKRLA